jgi:outer membrane lipoprotein-sorting protein
MRSVLSLVILVGANVAHAAPTGEEILARMDKNRDFQSTISTAKMTIQSGKEIRTKTMKMEGLPAKRKSIVEFTNKEDRGTRYLMIGQDLWIYFPEEDDVVKISGHMLKDGMMGSDVSYEDALASDTLTQKYQVSVGPDENIKDRPCYVLTLDAKVKDAPYAKRKMWVDQASYQTVKEELYAKSGKLLKVSQVLELKQIGNRQVPVRSEITNMLRKDAKTTFELIDVQYDVPIPEDRFTMQNLRK